jgi:hypothetical protein
MPLRMKRREFLKSSGLAGAAVAAVAGGCGQTSSAAGGPAAAGQAAESPRNLPIRPGHPEWPRAWTTYKKVASLEEDWADLKAHGVGCINRDARNADDAKAALELARRHGMKYHIGLGEVTEQASLVKGAGLAPVDALMIGGAYRGKAIDRHLFAFTAGRHEIIIEPPVYNKGFAYTRGSGGTGPAKAAEKIAHYYPDMPAPVRAEVVVPLKAFDGRQHLKIVPAGIAEAPPEARPENDTVTADLPESGETKNRSLYRLSFDLTGLDGALLDQVGLAVYWPYRGSRQYWMFQGGAASAWADSSVEALRRHVRERLAPWIEANGGTFPLDVVLAARFGDECFYITGHMGAACVSYPLWEYSDPSVEAFRRHAGAAEVPRTWGFPEVYGPEAYGWWLYTLHEGCARLAGAVREEIAQAAPGLLLFRNTTRMGVFDLSNDHDGSGQELLTRNLDVVHLDPYPVSGGYGQNIPRDMSYCAGLARRYHRLLIPWMQAHVYGSLQDPSPDQIDRMADEQYRQGVDAVIWLGYGNTFPAKRPDSWERAAAFHKRLREAPPAKPKARLAVLRSYRAWALSSRWEDKVRNPADWMLQQWLEVWAVQHGQPYDVFELPPVLGKAGEEVLSAALKKYEWIVSTVPREGAWEVGTGTEGQAADLGKAGDLRREFEAQMKQRGWLDAKP